MDVKEFILKALERTPMMLANALKDVRPDELKWRPGPQANSIGFILWHVTRSEDRFIHTLIQQKPQVWEQPKWHQLFPNLPSDPAATGYGFTSDQVAEFQMPKQEDLMQYNQAVRAATVDFLKGLPQDELNKTIDHPRLGKITYAEVMALLLGEINSHIGQMDYIRGLAQSLRK
jgi:uncharacterized damage-inducible protein DinB